MLFHYSFGQVGVGGSSGKLNICSKAVAQYYGHGTMQQENVKFYSNCCSAQPKGKR